MKRHIISRPARALLPAALAVCSLFIPVISRLSLRLMMAILMSRLFSLASGAAFRITAGSVVNDARLRGNFITALISAAVGGAISVTVCLLPIPYISCIGMWMAITGALINIAQLCCDRFYAAFDSFSPSLFDIIIAALTIAGLLMSEGVAWLLPGCVLAAVVAGFMLVIGLRSGSGIKPGFAIIKNSPIAILNSVLFQGTIVVLSQFLGVSAIGTTITLAAVALLELCESPFRRNLAESSPVTIAISLCAIGTALCAQYINDLPNNYMCNMLFACMGVLITGVHIDLRRILMLACICVMSIYAAYPGSGGHIITIAVCVVLTALCIPEIISMRRVAHARHLQRRRAR